MKPKRFALLIALALLWLLMGSSNVAHAQITIYYVDAVHGNDQTGDGSPANPWCPSTGST